MVGQGTWAYLRNAKEVGRVTKLPVAQLVGKNSDNLFSFALLDKSIVDNNVLLPGETKEIGVGVGAALAAIDDVELVQGKLEAGGEGFNTRLEVAILERGELVEQGQDGNGVDGDHEDLETSSESPEVEEELVARLLDNLEETGKNGRGEDKSQELGLEDVGDKELRGLLVEAKLFLEDEGVVDGRGERQDLVEDHEGQDKDNRVADLTSKSFGSEAEQEVAGPRPEFWQDVEVDEGEVLDLAPEAVDDAKLGFCATIGLGLVKDFLGDFLGQDDGGLGFLEDAVLAEGEEGLEEILADGEAHDEALPGEERAIEEAREALFRSIAVSD
jgi:hypothetical protein